MGAFYPKGTQMIFTGDGGCHSAFIPYIGQIFTLHAASDGIRFYGAFKDGKCINAPLHQVRLAARDKEFMDLVRNIKEKVVVEVM